MPIINEQILNEISGYKDLTLRDYQEDAKLKIYNQWKTVDSVLLQMPTGTGKTKLFVSVINDLMGYSQKHFSSKEDDFKVLILAHRKELIDQIVKEINSEYNLQCSKIDAETKTSPSYSESICVASVQTLSKRLRVWDDHPFDLIVVDEAHHAKANSYCGILKTYHSAKVLGVTATPYRMNGEGFGSLFYRIIISPSIKEFITAGWLSHYDYYSIKNSNKFYRDLDTVKLNFNGDYSISSLWDYCKPDRIQAEVVATYLLYAKGKKGIVYTINQQHNRKLCEEFRKCGIIAYGIDCNTKADERERIVNRFRAGEITILCNVDIFTEGFDCPDVEFVQLARPTKSLGLYLQQVGRGLRISNEKDKVIFLDNVGLYNRFGLPSSKRQWAHHFVGNKNVTDFGRQYADIKDEEPTFPINKRNPDLSEGNEDVSLIETTGLDEIKRKTEDDYLASYEEELKVIIELIFETNTLTYEQYIRGFNDEKNMNFDANVIEDILNPCPIITAETDDMDAVQHRIENEYKPIVVNGEIAYSKFKDWDDYKNTIIDKVKKIFKIRLAEIQSSNIANLDNYTANQLLLFFKKYYGKDHNMTKRISKYCKENSYYDKWEEMKKKKSMWQYSRIKNVRVEKFNGITNEFWETEYYE